MRVQPVVLLLLLLTATPGQAESVRVDTVSTTADTMAGKTVRVGIYPNKPKIFIDEDGKPSGLFVDVLTAIAERAEWDVEWVACSWSDCLGELQAGRLDLLPDVAWSAARDAWMDFHQDEVIENWAQVFVAPGSGVEHWSDLDGKRLALLEDSIVETSIGSLLRGFGYDTEIVPVGSWHAAFEMVRDGEVTAAAPSNFFGNYFFREYGLERTALVAEPHALFFATAASANPLLLRDIDTHLGALKSEPGSVYYLSLSRWLERPAPPGLPSYFLWILAVGGGLLLWSGSTIYLLRHRVRVRTRHLAEANRALTDSENKFRSLFEHNSAVKLLMRPEDGRIVEANQAAATFYGWPRAELLTMTFQDLAVADPSPVDLRDLLRKGGDRFEQEHRVADGSMRYVDVFAATVQIGEDVCIHALVYDISEHRSLEEQLRHAQKMEAVGRLAGGVAHDFNNFLGVIIGHAELALYNLPADLPPDAPVRNSLTEILAAANKSKTVTQQLMAFARKSVTRPVAFEVNARIEEMYNILKRLIGEEIELKWSSCGDKCVIHMDPSQLDQVLANLCVNARDAIEGTGTITISTSCAKSHICIAVQDDGCGMDAETVKSIFEPFYTTKEVGHGTGLGLAMAYGIVEQAGGHIEVTSTPGEGSTFRLFLPRYEGELGTPETAQDVTEAGTDGATILLVDDEAAIVEMTKLALETLGYTVIAARSPAEALERIEAAECTPTLLMTDVVMPQMNGRELATRIRARWPDVRVLYMSGYTDNILEHKGIVEGDVHLIQKPFSMADLSAKIKEVLG